MVPWGRRLDTANVKRQERERETNRQEDRHDETSIQTETFDKRLKLTDGEKRFN